MIVISCCPQPPIEVYGRTISHVQDFKHLDGMMASSSGSMMASSRGDLKRGKGLPWTAFWKLEHLWRCPSISIPTKIKLFNTTCVTVLLYGCEVWVLSKAMESEINAFGTSCYWIMLNVKRIDRVSNATIYDLTQASPLVGNVRTVIWGSVLGQVGYLMMSLARSMHCISHHMGRGNQKGNESCFSLTFNTYWDTQTTWLARTSCLNWHRTVVVGRGF